MSSYADASIRGAGEPDGENTVPIEDVNVTLQEIKEAVVNRPSSDEEEEDSVKEKIPEEAKEKVQKESKKAKKAFKKTISELESDPYASAGVLAAVLAAVATTVGVVHSKKNNATITFEQGAIVGAGIALVSTGYYFLLTRGAPEFGSKK